MLTFSVSLTSTIASMMDRQHPRYNMPVSSRLFFSRLFLLATVLGLCNHSVVVAFHSRHVAIRPSTKLAPPVPSRVIQPFQRSISIQSHIVDDDIFLINSLYDNPESAVVTSTTRGLPWFSSWLASMRTDRKQMAELGISFMLSYNLISNINGSMFLSLSWYISSVRVSGNKYCRSLRRCLLSSHAHHAEDGFVASRTRWLEAAIGGLCWFVCIQYTGAAITLCRSRRVYQESVDLSRTDTRPTGMFQGVFRWLCLCGTDCHVVGTSSGWNYSGQYLGRRAHLERNLSRKGRGMRVHGMRLHCAGKKLLALGIPVSRQLLPKRL
jgi:hypothetical protein